MKTRGLFVTLGALLLALLVHNYGFEHLTEDTVAVGASGLLLMSLTFIPTLIGYSIAWLLCTPHTRFKNLGQFFIASAQSFSWNQLTPFVKIGGEFSKVSSLKRFLPEADAITSVLVYNLSHTVGTLLSFAIGGIGISVFFVTDGVLKASLLATGLLFAIITLLVFFSPGLVQSICLSVRRPEWADHFHLVRRWTVENPKRFWSSVLVEVAARLFEGITFYTAFFLLKAPISVGTAVFLEISRSLMDTAIFFVPYNLGSREASLEWVLKSIFNDPKQTALSAILLYRWVELSWTLIGFALWTIAGRARKSGMTVSTAE